MDAMSGGKSCCCSSRRNSSVVSRQEIFVAIPQFPPLLELAHETTGNSNSNHGESRRLLKKHSSRIKTIDLVVVVVVVVVVVAVIAVIDLVSMFEDHSYVR
jgi:hypothetical protein